MTSPVLLTAIDGPVATITLNRPDRLNAMNLPMWQALGDALAAITEQSQTGEGPHCLILRGAGGKAFAAGADIEEFETVRATPTQAKDYDLIMRRALTLVRDCPLPVIAAIEGACVGGGLELACLCDLRISNESGRFGVPINRIGVVMAYPEIQAIQRLIGPAHTLSILLEAKILPAAKALRMGLVNRVIPDNAFEDHLAESARNIASGAPGVNAWHKKFVRRLLDSAPISATELDECYDFLNTEDYREGIAAFTEKRKPVFKGK